jgi:hypothetical protein
LDALSLLFFFFFFFFFFFSLFFFFFFFFSLAVSEYSVILCSERIDAWMFPRFFQVIEFQMASWPVGVLLGRSVLPLIHSGGVC